MARLIKSGDFVGPGERLTAARLEADLPDSWVVIANKILVGRDGSTREIDFIVVGDNAIFIVDEKHWHGVIRGDDKGWVLSGGDSQGSPISKMEMAARGLIGSLKRNVPRLADGIRDRPFVHARVLLSADDVACRVMDPRVERQVVKLEQAPNELIFDDRRQDAKASIAPFRTKIIEELTRLRDRPRIPAKVAEYEVLDVVQDRGASMTLLARHADGSELLLQLIERRATEVRSTADAERGNLREYDALRRLSELDRAASVHPYFGWREDDYWVVPMDLLDGASLRALVVESDRPDAAIALEVFRDAYAGLGDIHEAGILHRNISPDTVVVDRNRRTRFADFSLARVPEGASLSGNAEHIASDAFIAPEVRLGFGFAEPRSDVYSLTTALLYWLTGIEPPAEHPWSGDPAFRAAAETLIGAEAADVIGRCLAQDERDRPEAHVVAEHLQRLVESEPTPAVAREQGVQQTRPGPPEVGDEIEGQYLIEAILGRGTMGIAYLARDTVVDRHVVLKTLLNPEYVRALAANEFNMLAGVMHPGIQRVYDVRPPDSPFHLKLEYVPGSTVAQAIARRKPDPALAERLIREIGDVLKYLEERSLVHRDISSANVLVPDDPGRPAMLLDFGLAAPAAAITAVGTARYRDPAVERGSPWTPAADRYALGVLAFEVAIGRLPYDDSGNTVDKRQIVELDGLERSALPAHIVAALRDAVDPLPERRFRSATDMLAAFVAPPANDPAGLPAGLVTDGDASGLRTGRSVIGGRFVLVPESIVSGGVADVYQAVDLENPVRPVAIKLIRDSPERNRLEDLFFDREVNALRQLRHGHVVELIAGGRDVETGRYFVALEWIPQTLDVFLGKRKDVAWEWFAQAVALPLAGALAAAHERQIIHRDVKPSNVLVTGEGAVKLADFGISVLTTRLPDTSRTLANFGSAPYSPPEREPYRTRLETRLPSVCW